MAGSQAGPVMSREEVDRALARLEADHAAVETSLFALEAHQGRRLLEGTRLTGRTAERWAAAAPAVPLLWSRFAVWGEALATARAVRGKRRWPPQADLAELTELLRGSGVLVSDAGLPDAARELAGASGMTERVGLELLAERMDEWYDLVMAVVGAADAVWSTLPARIAALTAEAGRVAELAASVGVLPGAHPSGDDLAALTGRLEELRARVATDPLAFWQPARRPGTVGRVDVRRYARAEHELEDIRREVEAVLRVRDDAGHRLLRLRDVLSRADRTLREARAARGEVLAKIAASEVPAVGGPPAELREMLLAAADFHRRGSWHLLSPLLDEVEDRADEELDRVRASLSAVTAPLAVRAELRGRLDAYKAKASRLAVGQDPLLVERYDQARRLLWSAPCDLRAADAAVGRYQEAVCALTASGRSGPSDGGGGRG